MLELRYNGTAKGQAYQLTIKANPVYNRDNELHPILINNPQCEIVFFNAKTGEIEESYERLLLRHDWDRNSVRSYMSRCSFLA